MSEPTGRIVRGIEHGLIGCEACGLVLERPAHGSDCPRCGTPVHARRPESLTRSWAFLVAAMILYIPANLLPVLHSTKLFESWSDTILSGVVALWEDGAYDLAIIVFTASIVVPLLKMGALALLLLEVQRGGRQLPRERALLYRILEYIGHWSMLDVFAVALLVTLVHFGTLASVEPGSGIVAFGAVVVLTMLATMSFDPRLNWDTPRRRDRPLPAAPAVNPDAAKDPLSP
ncbi:paraquat-inducible protein A [Nevskia ramosa]|uniref:paraquat-inducible protein A n=1 Tax=Nevskia ramosa TaxID=64002 RepID=UPI0023562D2C|nr:paraquat-inducible protein A [Nevskia ramosa]